MDPNAPGPEFQLSVRAGLHGGLLRKIEILHDLQRFACSGALRQISEQFLSIFFFHDDGTHFTFSDKMRLKELLVKDRDQRIVDVKRIERLDPAPPHVFRRPALHQCLDQSAVSVRPMADPSLRIPEECTVFRIEKRHFRL